MVQDHHNKATIKARTLPNMVTNFKETEAAGMEVVEEIGVEETKEEIGIKANREVFLAIREETGIKANQAQEAELDQLINTRVTMNSLIILTQNHHQHHHHHQTHLIRQKKKKITASMILFTRRLGV